MYLVKYYSSTLVQVDARATVVKLYYHERKTVFIVGVYYINDKTNTHLALGGANIVVNGYYVPICKTYINVLCNYTPSTLHIQRHIVLVPML